MKIKAYSPEHVKTHSWRYTKEEIETINREIEEGLYTAAEQRKIMRESRRYHAPWYYCIDLLILDLLRGLLLLALCILAIPVIVWILGFLLGPREVSHYRGW